MNFFLPTCYFFLIAMQKRLLNICCFLSLFDFRLSQEDASKLKVLHLSDTHFDRQYAEGSWAECSLPLCCRVENELPDENATTAGKWGGWKCDTNERTFDHLLQHIITQHPVSAFKNNAISGCFNVFLNDDSLNFRTLTTFTGRVTCRHTTYGIRRKSRIWML